MLAAIAREAVQIGAQVAEKYPRRESTQYNDTSRHVTPERPHLVLIRSEPDPGCQN